jgi:hypothetical protein
MQDDNLSQVLPERFLIGHYKLAGEEEKAGKIGPEPAGKINQTGQF